MAEADGCTHTQLEDPRVLIRKPLTNSVFEVTASSNSPMHRPQSRQELEQAVQSVLWWPSALTFLVLGLTYSLISEPDLRWRRRQPALKIRPRLSRRSKTGRSNPSTPQHENKS